MYWNVFCLVSFTDANVAKVFKVYGSRKARLKEINAREKKR